MEQAEHKEYQFCLRCGKKLKKPEARLIGMGEICKKKIKIKEKKKLF